jgi:hypothetical protein
LASCGIAGAEVNDETTGCHEEEEDYCSRTKEKETSECLLLL